MNITAREKGKQQERHSTDLLIPQPLSNRVVDDAHFELAYQCALPAFEALAAGDHDTEALLAVAFSPLVHTLLDRIAPTGIWSVLVLLRRLVEPPHPQTMTQLSTPRDAWRYLKTHRRQMQLAAFDLRPGGSAEFEAFAYVPLYNQQGQIGTFYTIVLPLVVAVLQGWGAALLVIHPQPTRQLPLVTLQAQAQAQWTTLIQS